MTKGYLKKLCEQAERENARLRQDERPAIPTLKEPK